MANDLLIAAIRSAGLDNHRIAELVGVDPKTVERWVAGRVPHPRYRGILARELGVAPSELWPDAAQRRAKAGLEEIAGAWARRDDADAPDWRALLREAQTQVDLIGYSLLSIAETPRGLDALAAKARDGLPVRIALADPRTEHVLAADLAARNPGRLIARIGTATERFAALAAVNPGVELRHHRMATTHTILRFDDHLLLGIHLHGTPGIHAPQLHLHRRGDYGIFDQLVRHVEEIWHTARPLGGAPVEDPRPALAEPARQSAADALLDTLDNVWRPGHR